MVAKGEVRGIPPLELRERLPAFLQGIEDGVASAYVHVDLDVLDPSEGRANRYAAAGGLVADDVVWAIEQVRARLPLGAVGLTAYDPSFDPEGRIVASGLRIAAAVTSVGR
jgi:arginase